MHELEQVNTLLKEGGHVPLTGSRTVALHHITCA